MHAWISPESNIGAVHACRYFDVIECHLEIAVIQGWKSIHGVREVFPPRWRSWKKHFRVAFRLRIIYFQDSNRRNIFAVDCDMASYETHNQNSLSQDFIHRMDHFNVYVQIFFFIFIFIKKLNLNLVEIVTIRKLNKSKFKFANLIIKNISQKLLDFKIDATSVFLCLSFSRKSLIVTFFNRNRFCSI